MSDEGEVSEEIRKARAWIFDKKENREYSKEEKLERYRRMVQTHKTWKPTCYKEGKICINNGVEERWILKDMPVPDGWVRGILRRGKKE